ncbi:hypothetical protein CLOP_g22972 [Closterium sp. NIES-67]|nr:hypothetical protein CLOP_g22972 [Closterium sp. NIES-67]
MTSSESPSGLAPSQANHFPNSSSSSFSSSSSSIYRFPSPVSPPAFTNSTWHHLLMPHQHHQLHPFLPDTFPSHLHLSSPLPWSSLEQVSAFFQRAGEERFLPKWIHIFSLSPCLQHASFLFLSSFLLLATLSHILILPKPNPEPSSKPDSQPRRAQNGTERSAGTGGRGERGVQESCGGREQKGGEEWRAGLLFWPELVLSIIAAACWTGLLLWEILPGFRTHPAPPHNLAPPHELAYAAGQAVTYALAAGVLLLFERRRDATVVGSARVWLFLNAVLVLMLSMVILLRLWSKGQGRGLGEGSGVGSGLGAGLGFGSGGGLGSGIRDWNEERVTAWSDFLTLGSLPLAVFLGVVGVLGRPGWARLDRGMGARGGERGGEGREEEGEGDGEEEQQEEGEGGFEEGLRSRPVVKGRACLTIGDESDSDEDNESDTSEDGGEELKPDSELGVRNMHQSQLGQQQGQQQQAVVVAAVSPYATASWLSRLSFSWISPLLDTGNQNLQLQQQQQQQEQEQWQEEKEEVPRDQKQHLISLQDVPCRPPSHGCDAMFRAFDACWQTQLALAAGGTTAAAAAAAAAGSNAAAGSISAGAAAGSAEATVTTPLLATHHQQQGHEQPQLQQQQQQQQSPAMLSRFTAPTKPSVAQALLACFWRPLLFTGLLILLKAAVMYAGPLLLSRFVDLAAGKGQFEGEGLVLVVVLLLAKATETAVGHQYNFQAQSLGLDIRAALVGALYHKGLRLSSRAKQRHTVGEVVNYMSTDVQRLADLMLQLHNVWVLPLQIAIALVILFKVVGVCMLAGLAVMLAAMVFNLLIAASLRAAVAQILKAKDRRMKATSEALSAMRVIKLYAWQTFFENQIKSLRDSEAGWLGRYMAIGATNIFLLWLSPLAVSVGTFGAMVAVGVPLTPGAVFTAIATFRILQEPLRSFPSVVAAMAQALVSLKRVTSFLLEEEIQIDAVLRLEGKEGGAGNTRGVATPLEENKKGSENGRVLQSGGRERGSGREEVECSGTRGTVAWDGLAGGGGLAGTGLAGTGLAGTGLAGTGLAGIGLAGTGLAGGGGLAGTTGLADDVVVRVQGGVFSWDGDSSKPTLSGIELEIKRGMRVAVCGAVGAGKSSLLSCLLGEMPKIRGEVALVGCTAYVPQSAWIQNATVRDNILFGQPVDRARYSRVLQQCALQLDLALLAHGDATQIGERGVNLSGGQKQRIQLARAMYAGGGGSGGGGSGGGERSRGADQKEKEQGDGGEGKGGADEGQGGADVFLLDDPFSAVDAHTGSQLFTECVLRGLAGKTVILVTHQVDFLPAMDLILVMREGRIVQHGRYDELLAQGTDFSSLVDAHTDAMHSLAATGAGDAASNAAATGSAATGAAATGAAATGAGVAAGDVTATSGAASAVAAANTAAAGAAKAGAVGTVALSATAPPTTSSDAAENPPSSSSPSRLTPQSFSSPSSFLQRLRSSLGLAAAAGGAAGAAGGAAGNAAASPPAAASGDSPAASAAAGRGKGKQQEAAAEGGVVGPKEGEISEEGEEARNDGSNEEGDRAREGRQMVDIGRTVDGQRADQNGLQAGEHTGSGNGRKTSRDEAGARASNESGSEKRRSRCRKNKAGRTSSGGSGGGNGGGSSRRSIGQAGTGQLISDEERSSGRVAFAVYWAYLTAALGCWPIPALLLVQTLWQTLQIGSDWWLATYTSTSAPSSSYHSSSFASSASSSSATSPSFLPPSSASSSSFPINLGAPSITPVGFLRLYVLLALGSVLFVLVRTVAVSWMGWETAQTLFAHMLHAVFRAPMAFFDSTPAGRVLSRASTDQATVDLDLPFRFGTVLSLVFQLLGILTVTSLITWPVLFAIVPLAYFYFSYQEYYLTTSRELSRLDGITKSPIIEHFSESLAGAAVIRAFAQEPRFARNSAARVDANTRVAWCSRAAVEWLGFRLELLGSLLLCFSALMLTLLPASVVSPGLAGMSLSYGLALSQGLFFVVWAWCGLENQMVSVERILQFSHPAVPSEAPLVVHSHRPSGDWPQHGRVEFDNLQVQYRPDLPMVLKGVTLTIQGGHKVGIVGRTGSGKSTLVAALFRLVEPASGRVLIDDVDIGSIGLGDLRGRLAIIPQDPTLFQGPIRMNLDPAGEYSDAQIWEALDRCQLGDTVRGMEAKLEAQVVEGGENWSVGQRQLFCLGRALLKNSRILVLDEATASVDSATDVAIQRTIKESFGRATIISIAHRIATVIDSDMVVVMDQGTVAECNSPAQLLQDPESMFSRLVAEYAVRSSGLADIAKSLSLESLANAALS